MIAFCEKQNKSNHFISECEYSDLDFSLCVLHLEKELM